MVLIILQNGMVCYTFVLWYFCQETQYLSQLGLHPISRCNTCYTFFKSNYIYKFYQRDQKLKKKKYIYGILKKIKLYINSKKVYKCYMPLRNPIKSTFLGVESCYTFENRVILLYNIQYSCGFRACPLSHIVNFYHVVLLLK